MGGQEFDNPKIVQKTLFEEKDEVLGELHVPEEGKDLPFSSELLKQIERGISVYNHGLGIYKKPAEKEHLQACLDLLEAHKVQEYLDLIERERNLGSLIGIYSNLSKNSPDPIYYDIRDDIRDAFEEWKNQ